MTNRLYWHYLNTYKSIYLSKNYLDTIKEIPSVKKIKIRIFFSKKLVRSTILLFWFLFLVFGSKIIKKQLVKPTKRVLGLGTKQAILTLSIYNLFDIYTFIDKWTKTLYRRNLIYLRKRFVSKGSVFLQYSKIIRPYNYTKLTALDPGVDYFISKAGFFQIYFNFWNIEKTKINTFRNKTWDVSLVDLDDNILPGVSTAFDIYSKESTLFYVSSLNL